jgi:hypothetical protein
MKTVAVLAALVILPFALLGLAQSTTHPTTQAATPATMPSVKDAQATLDSATLALKQAQAAAELRLQTIPAYQKLLAAVDAASAKRDAIRESDAASPQDKVDAASAVGTAKKAADDFKSKYIAADPGVVTATNAVTAATANLKAAQAADALIQAQSAANETKKEKKFVMPAKQYKALPTGNVDGHRGFFGDPNIGAVGYVNTFVLGHIVDDSTAIVSTYTSDSSGNLGDLQLMVEGLSTAGQTDAGTAAWTVKRWFIIVGTKKYNGTTYPLAEEIVQGQ